MSKDAEQAAADPAAPYWAAAENGQLWYQRCADCGHVPAFPKEYCPRCARRSLEWRVASGRGTIYTFSVVHRAPDPELRDRIPYVLAMVDLAEGLRRMTWIVDCPPEAVRIGMPVRVAFRKQGGRQVPCFMPDAASAANGEVQR